MIANKFNAALVETGAMILGRGTYTYSSITSSADNFLLEGKGAGQTFIVCPGGVKITGKNPRIRGVTIVGTDNLGTGLYLQNSRKAVVDDVEVYGFKDMMIMEVVEDPTEALFNWCWLSSLNNLTLTEAADGGAAAVPATSQCRGLVLRYTGTRDRIGFQYGLNFFNSLSVRDSYFNTWGAPLTISGVDLTNFNNVYLGGQNDPILIDNGATSMNFFGCTNEVGAAVSPTSFKFDDAYWARFRWFGNHNNFKADGKCVDSAGTVIDNAGTHTEKGNALPTTNYIIVDPAGYWV